MVILGAVVLFTAASALCGAAQSPDQLIAFRAIQGVGGGMVLPEGTKVPKEMREEHPCC
ncbi:MFS transporter [Candidatus Protofrankia californiensis]|uniref:MFS transporter n=1 Tax=Candidatus Protofrankia californiensis TaxID=1839754 RepID=UPI0013ED6B23|nr:MFS transporter [Candidatus Protofrankia californiensis]